MEIQTHTIRFKRAFRIAFATILVTTLLLKPQSASACSCYGTVYYASQMMKKNDAVFVGYVEREFSMSRVPGVRNALDPLLYRSLPLPKVSLWIQKIFYFRYTRLKVVSSWKGVETRRVTLVSSGTSCDMEFQKEEYLIFAWENEGDYHTSWCSGTTTVDDAGEALSFLNILPSIPLVWLPPVDMAGIGALIASVSLSVLIFRQPKQRWRRYLLQVGVICGIYFVMWAAWNWVFILPKQEEVHREIAELVEQQVELDKRKPMANRGQLFWYGSFDCSGCHSYSILAGESVVPSLRGLFGREVMLDNGMNTVVDEEYIRNAIVDPQKHTFDGYIPAPMPEGYEGFFIEKGLKQFPDLEVSPVWDLVEYIKTLEE